MTLKDEPPRPEGVHCATGEERRRITNSPRMNEAAGPMWIGRLVVGASGDERKI